MDFVYLFRVLLKRKWIILSATVAAAIIAYFLTKNEVRQYKSVARISTGFATSDEIKITNDNFNYYEADTKFNNAIVTFVSPTVVSLLSYKLILHDLQNNKPFRTLNSQQKKSEVYTAVHTQQAIDMFENKLLTMSVLTSFKPEEKQLLEFLNLYGYDYNSLSKDLNVYRLQHTDYIQIEYKSENPQLSAFVVNNVFSEFQRYNKTIRSEKSMESIDTLQSLLEKKKHDLDSINAALRSLGAIDATVESTSKFELITQLETTLAEEQNKNTQLAYSLEKIKQKLSKQGAGKAVSSSNNDELLLLRRTMNEAYTAYLNSGSSDQTLLNKYNRLKTDYQNKVAESGTYGSDKKTGGDNNGADLQDKKSDLEVDLQASNDNIRALQARISALKGNMMQDASKNVAVETLLKEADQANKDYLAVKQRYNDATDITSASVNNFRQVLLGQPAIEPEPSKRMLIVGMAGASAFVLCVLVIVLLTYLDLSIKTPDIFSKVVNLRLISMVNFVHFRNRRLIDLVAATHTSADEPADKRRNNQFRESIRKLRFEVERSGKKTFLFTSTRKGEGKTTLIQALAYSMSLSKKKVLIIDTNFCNNDLTMQLNAAPVLDQLQYQSGETLVGSVNELVRNAGMETVFAIGCNSGDYTPSEFLPRESVLYHLHSLTEEYDFIFLEGPPLNDFSDSKELAQHVDGVIAIFSANHSIKQIDKESIGFFKSMNGKFCGAVLNMVWQDNVALS